MQIVVVGLGSMGKRRIRLLQQFFPQHTVAGVDAQPARRAECAEAFGIKTFASFDEAVQSTRPQAALICTSPLSHAALIAEALQNGLHVFTEINLVPDRYAENIRAAQEKGLTLFLSSTFLYREEIRRIRALLAAQTRPVSYTYHVGQYLPDWHPWESYKNFFLGDKRTDGCREILTIDLPWLLKTFGPVEDVHVFRTKLTQLEIDYPDTYCVSLRHQNGCLGVFVADVVARAPFRELRVSGEDLLITWDGTPDSLRRFDIEKKAWETIPFGTRVAHRDGYAATITEDAYLEELQAFFAAVERGEIPPYTFADDYETLRLIDRIEQV